MSENRTYDSVSHPSGRQEPLTHRRLVRGLSHSVGETGNITLSTLKQVKQRTLEPIKLSQGVP